MKGDGKVLRDWITKSSPQPATCLSLSVKGVKSLELECDLNGSRDCDLATWANARVVASEETADGVVQWTDLHDAIVTPGGSGGVEEHGGPPVGWRHSWARSSTSPISKCIPGAGIEFRMGNTLGEALGTYPLQAPGHTCPSNIAALLQV